jgi:hypothetical protein
MSMTWKRGGYLVPITKPEVGKAKDRQREAIDKAIREFEQAGGKIEPATEINTVQRWQK